ncbi:MAG: DEAD/DEAH box helicase [Myxococcales bacterium]|nr:DEAD/DEAH box helicase [Myxococcales bacterium]
MTPRGQLTLVDDGDQAPVGIEVAARLRAGFAGGDGAGLVWLGTAEVRTTLPASLGFWRDLGARYVATVCARGEDAAVTPVAPPDLETLTALAAAAPPAPGAEYVDAALLDAVWRRLDDAFRAEVDRTRGGVAALLRARDAAWHLVGRVHFNLAEHRGDDDAPFAFLATYTTSLNRQARAQHVPLGQALRDYAGARARAQLHALLSPVQRAAERCAWVAELVESGDVYHPLRWSAAEASRLLRDVPALEAAGVVVRMPAGWGGARPPRPQATVTVGSRAPGGLGLDALLDYRAEVSLDGEPLTDDELRALLDGADGLRLLRGRWVELDREQLAAALDRLRAAERATADGLSFAEAMRLVAGASLAADDAAPPEARPRVVPGPWLAETLAGLRAPDGLAAIEPGEALHARLRPYQEVGVRWLYLLTRLGLGACLADDMGLGKTIQVIALLLVSRRPRAATPPSLLVAPASLLGNWTDELARFAPGLRVRIAHASSMPADRLTATTPPVLRDVDLVITSYGTLPRVPWLTAGSWDLLIVDEAQAIKNPGARQTRAIKALRARARIAMTGTPVENRLGDLWSIFDFLNPGLLGTARQFTTFTRQLDAGGYGPLRALIQPYVLRRLKSDRRIVADLPDKTEVIAYCGLSPRQAALYQQTVDELGGTLRRANGMQRRGLVLAALTRLKQICNHPAHGLAGDDWPEADSGKLGRVRELAEVVAAKQEQLLVFTQFREATTPLAALLASVFGRDGAILHGGTPVAQRARLVRRFQDGDAPFFVLSLKAGGTGLNLTAAAHVVHFDRWWNPAVEDQATDRAYRIGQHRNVLVHKLVCRGTVEEKVDALIAGKRALARELLEGDGAAALTELSDAQLMDLVALDLGRAMVEGTGNGAAANRRKERRT